MYCNRLIHSPIYLFIELIGLPFINFIYVFRPTRVKFEFQTNCVRLPSTRRAYFYIGVFKSFGKVLYFQNSKSKRVNDYVYLQIIPSAIDNSNKVLFEQF